MEALELNSFVKINEQTSPERLPKNELTILTNMTLDKFGEGFLPAKRGGFTRFNIEDIDALPVQTGDLILLWIRRHGSGGSSGIGTPTGFTLIYTAKHPSGISDYGLFYKIATEPMSSISVGLQTGFLTAAAVSVYRYAEIGASANWNASANSITYAAITPEISDGTSWIVACGGTGALVSSDGINLTLPPNSGTHRTYALGGSPNTNAGSITIHDKANITAWLADSKQSTVSSFNNESVCVELKEIAGGNPIIHRISKSKVQFQTDTIVISLEE